MQRNKGATFERTIANRLSEKFGRKVQRNIGQARDGGNDIDFPPFVIECKRYKSLGLLERALEQAEAAVSKKGQVPLVVAKSDQKPTMVALRFEDFLDIVATLQAVADDALEELL